MSFSNLSHHIFRQLLQPSPPPSGAKKDSATKFHSLLKPRDAAKSKRKEISASGFLGVPADRVIKAPSKKDVKEKSGPPGSPLEMVNFSCNFLRVSDGLQARKTNETFWGFCTATLDVFPFPCIAPPSSPSHACAWWTTVTGVPAFKGMKPQTSIDIYLLKRPFDSKHRILSKQNTIHKLESKQKDRCSSILL